MALEAPIDPTILVKALRNQLEIRSAEPQMDDKELAEREEAAQAYGREDEAHFVRYLEDCVKMSTDAMQTIRQQQSECWDVYMEKEPPNFAYKEDWQSRVVIPKPYSYVQFFLAIVRKAFDPQFLSVENTQEDFKDDAYFIKDLMSLMLSRTFSNFPINFTDATGMAGAVGQSMEMIPQWRPGRGLYFDLIEPWKVHRDPDALSRQSQSGMYWVHEEWLDYYQLKELEKKGILRNVPDCGPGGSWGNPKNPDLNQEELKRRRDMLHQQSNFRTKVLTREFWGISLDKRGELLLPNSTFTVVADRVVRLPKRSPYPNLRWPGTGFTPLPHLLRFDGRSLIQGIRSLWYAMCSLLALHIDNMNWIVNPPSEVDQTALVDQEDIDDYPGHLWLTHGTPHGQQAVRTIERKSQTGDVLANLKYGDQAFQIGGMLSYALQGLPDYRAEVTARESAQNLEQSNTIVGLMGLNLDAGALDVIQAAYETVRINISYKELATWMGESVAAKYKDNDSATGLRLPELNGSFKISGVATLVRNQEVLAGLSNIVLPLLEEGRFGNIFSPYVKPYQLCRAIERRLNLEDEGVFVDQATAQRIDDAQQAEQEAAIQKKQEREAAALELDRAKTTGEEAKARMNLGKAEEHEGKAVLAHTKAHTEIQPPEPKAQAEAQGAQ